MPGFTTHDSPPVSGGITTTVPVTLASGGVSPVTCPECGYGFTVCCAPEPAPDPEAVARDRWSHWKALRVPCSVPEWRVEECRRLMVLHPRVETISHVICGTCVEPDRGHQLYPCATLRAFGLGGEA